MVNDSIYGCSWPFCQDTWNCRKSSLAALNQIPFLCEFRTFLQNDHLTGVFYLVFLNSGFPWSFSKHQKLRSQRISFDFSNQVFATDFPIPFQRFLKADKEIHLWFSDPLFATDLPDSFFFRIPKAVTQPVPAQLQHQSRTLYVICMLKLAPKIQYSVTLQVFILHCLI